VVKVTLQRILFLYLLKTVLVFLPSSDLPCIPSHLASILVDISSWVKKVATLGIDCNAKNGSWNSGRTKKIGAELEYCFLDHALSISNVDIALLPHKPLNTSFFDVALEGDSVSLSGWHYPFYSSLSDHPVYYVLC
jgi:hypothetical protein